MSDDHVPFPPAMPPQTTATDIRQADTRSTLPHGAETLSLLVFRLGTLWLALPTKVCKEVAAMPAIHTLPHRRGGILLGLVNIRGALQLCVSLGQLLGVEHRADSHAMPYLLVIEHLGDCWALPVDEIHGIYDILPGSVQPTPAPSTTTPPVLTIGRLDWQDKAVQYVDSELLFVALRREMV